MRNVKSKTYEYSDIFPSQRTRRLHRDLCSAVCRGLVNGREKIWSMPQADGTGRDPLLHRGLKKAKEEIPFESETASVRLAQVRGTKTREVQPLGIGRAELRIPPT